MCKIQFSAEMYFLLRRPLIIWCAGYLLQLFIFLDLHSSTYFFKAVKKKKEENQLLSGNKSGPSVLREMADPVTGEGRAPPGDLPPSVPDNFMSGHPDANVLSLVWRALHMFSNATTQSNPSTRIQAPQVFSHWVQTLWSVSVHSEELERTLLKSSAGAQNPGSRCFGSWQCLCHELPVPYRIRFLPDLTHCIIQMKMDVEHHLTTFSLQSAELIISPEGKTRPDQAALVCLWQDCHLVAASVIDLPERLGLQGWKSFWASKNCLACSQFSAVQSLGRVRLFAAPWTAAPQASLSITNPCSRAAKYAF